jgi:hypothetical protein
VTVVPLNVGGKGRVVAPPVERDNPPPKMENNSLGESVVPKLAEFVIPEIYGLLVVLQFVVLIILM